MKYRVLCKQIHMLLLYWSMNCALVLGTGTVYCVMGTRHWHWVLLLQYCIYALCPGFGVLCYWLYWVLCYSKRVIRHCLSSLHYTLSALQMEYSLSSTHERLSVTHSIIATLYRPANCSSSSLARAGGVECTRFHQTQVLGLSFGALQKILLLNLFWKIVEYNVAYYHTRRWCWCDVHWVKS